MFYPRNCNFHWCNFISIDLLACDGKKCADSCRFDGNLLGSCNQDGKCVQGDGLNCGRKNLMNTKL